MSYFEDFSDVFDYVVNGNWGIGFIVDVVELVVFGGGENCIVSVVDDNFG